MSIYQASKKRGSRTAEATMRPQQSAIMTASSKSRPTTDSPNPVRFPTAPIWGKKPGLAAHNCACERVARGTTGRLFWSAFMFNDPENQICPESSQDLDDLAHDDLTAKENIAQLIRLLKLANAEFIAMRDSLSSKDEARVMELVAVLIEMSTAVRLSLPAPAVSADAHQ
jgi:hypothetical protein